MGSSKGQGGSSNLTGKGVSSSSNSRLISKGQGQGGESSSSTLAGGLGSGGTKVGKTNTTIIIGGNATAGNRSNATNPSVQGNVPKKKRKRKSSIENPTLSSTSPNNPL